MPLSKTAQLDERIFRCAAYSWTVQIHRTTALPPEDPLFNTPEEAWEYFKKIKRTYTVIDENVSGSEETFDNWAAAWALYCKTIAGYTKFFPMLSKAPGTVVYTMRYDLPDPSKKEPVY
jgi:hypothetical protein